MTEKRQRRRIRDRARVKKSLSIIPSLFTIGNIFCGYFAIIATLRGKYDHAAIAIGVGYVLDGLDGRIARLTQTASDFGVQLDSLADVLSFGIAPAFLAFTWGLGTSEGMNGTAKHVHQLGWIATFLFVVCGALRLARFNVQTKKPPDGTSKRYFVGLPIPAAAGMIASIVHYFKSPIIMIGSGLLWCLLILLLAFLMISTVRYPSFKEFDVRKARPSLALFGAAMVITLIIFYSEYVLLLIATLFVSSGLILKLLQTVRRFLPSGVPASVPAHGNIKT
jgi:CDP-diacylglycerol---serine O-phosphatidyltransferase